MIVTSGVLDVNGSCVRAEDGQCTTAGWVAGFFGTSATYEVPQFNFKYTAKNQGLMFKSWTNADTGNIGRTNKTRGLAAAPTGTVVTTESSVMSITTMSFAVPVTYSRSRARSSETFEPKIVAWWIVSMTVSVVPSMTETVLFPRFPT